MKETQEKVNFEGDVRITKDFDHHFFLVHPRGFINPSLLDEDLKQARDFSENCKQPWTYCTNTEDVRLVNPFNILFLKEIKKLKKLKQIVIFAPGAINRLLIRLASPLIKPDRIISDKKEFKQFLKSMRVKLKERPSH